MSINNTIHQLKLKEWASLLADQKASGLTVKEWCKQNNLTIHKYNYWKHLLKEEVINQTLPDIVPLTLSDCSLNTAPILSTPNSIHDSNSVTSANRTIRATSQTISLSINDISFQLDSSVPEEFLCTLIKAVRHA